MSNVRIMVSTPAVAMTVSRYLFQSCVSASAGGKVCRFPPTEWIPLGLFGPWIGIRCTRWLEAEAGVRRSKTRRCESEVTEERTEGECGEKAVL